VSAPLRGEVWMVDFDPTQANEQAGRRPAVVLSSDLFNRTASGLVVVVPVTGRRRGDPLHVEIVGGEGGLPRLSMALPKHVRSINQRRLVHRMGVVQPWTLDLIADHVRRIWTSISGRTHCRTHGGTQGERGVQTGRRRGRGRTRCLPA